MDSTWLAQLLQNNSGILVFINVFLQQLGFPVPAVPTMMIAASQATTMPLLSTMLLAAIFASLLADWIWYQIGRKFGYRVLTLLCKLSINPSSCVNQTEARFSKWGVWSLVFGKFIPGFSTVAPPVAGALGMPRSSFFIASALGAGLWASVALLTGYVFHAQIDGVLVWLARNGIHLALLVVASIGVVVSWKFWQKFRFERMATMHHIDADDMMIALKGVKPPHLIDLRSHSLVEETGNIPSAHITDYDAITRSLLRVDKSYPIVTICACPQDAGAVQVANSLQALGYHNAYPLRGGFDAWKAATTRHKN